MEARKIETLESGHVFDFNRISAVTPVRFNKSHRAAPHEYTVNVDGVVYFMRFTAEEEAKRSREVVIEKWTKQ
jgi:hypothetical protein